MSDREVRATCEEAMARLAPLFAADCRLTLVVRHQTDADVFVVITRDEDLGKVAALLSTPDAIVAATHAGASDERDSILAMLGEIAQSFGVVAEHYRGLSDGERKKDQAETVRWLAELIRRGDHRLTSGDESRAFLRGEW